MCVEGQKKQMTPDCIRCNGDVLKQIIDPDFGLIPTMYSCGVLLNNERQRIMSKETTNERNEVLLDIMIGKSSEDCQKFLECLKSTEQTHVVNYIICRNRGRPKRQGQKRDVPDHGKSIVNN